VQPQELGKSAIEPATFRLLAQRRQLTAPRLTTTALNYLWK